MHAFRLPQTLSCLLPVPFSLLILASLLLSDCISTFIWYSQTALPCRAAFLIPRGGYTCRFLQREERIADSSPLLNSRPVLWATTPPPPLLVRTPLCHANCFVFFFLTLSLSSSILSVQKAVWKERRKKGLFSLFQNSAFETVWAHADRGNVLVDLWLQGQRFGFSNPLAVMTIWVVIAGIQTGTTGWFW